MSTLVQKEVSALRDDVEHTVKNLITLLNKKLEKLHFFLSKEIEKQSLLSSENIEDFLDLLPLDEIIKTEIDELDYAVAGIETDISKITGMEFQHFEQELELYTHDKKSNHQHVAKEYFSCKEKIKKQLGLLLNERNKLIDTIQTIQNRYKIDIEELKELQEFYISDL